MKIISEKLTSEWRGSITLFDGFYSTRPADEIQGVPWGLYVHAVATAHGPAVVQEKDNAPYFVTCNLKVAPLTGKTRERAEINGACLEGKQRSAGHITASNVLVFDLDGLEQQQLDSVRECVESLGLTALIYSTHSHGRNDKPGVRARVLLPMDTALESATYTRAWRGVAKQLFAEVEVDASSSRIHQQQGVWATAAERVQLAFRHDIRGGLINAQAAVDAGPLQPIKAANPVNSHYANNDVTERLEAALAWLDPNNTTTWHTLMMAFKAVAPLVGMDAARSMAIRYSEAGNPEATAKNIDAKYDPATFFDGAAPTMPPEAGMATLCANARDMAGGLFIEALQAGKLAERSVDAAKYLAINHPKRFEEIRGIYGNR